MSEPVQPVSRHLIVFGRGLDHIDGQYVLTEAARSRVDTACQYLEKTADRMAGKQRTVVFSGGYAGAADGITPPPESRREGRLMLEYASSVFTNDADQDIRMMAETASTSTLENALCVYESSVFRGTRFTAEEPLGLVAHAEHARRVRFFMKRVFKLNDSQLELIPASGPDRLSSGMPEPLLYGVTRLLFAGARSAEALRCREALAVRMANLLR